MSAADLTDRPAFASVDSVVEYESKRISRLAIVTLLVGLLSLNSLLSSVLLPLAALAIVLGIVAIFRIALDPALGGSIFAQIGLGCGVVAFICSVSFANYRSNHLFTAAGENAETFLNYLTDDDKYYEALQLLRSEQNRQITGTDLKAYYDNLDGKSESGLLDFFNEGGTKLVLASKGHADWRYQGGVKIWGTEKNRFIKVTMRNAAPNQGQVVDVTLQRITGLLLEDEGPPTAHWNIYDLSIP